MKLNEVIKRQYGERSDFEKAYSLFVEFLKDFEFFQDEKEGYKNETLTRPTESDHATNFSAMEHRLNHKAICVSFTSYSKIYKKILEIQKVAGNSEGFRKYCNERGIDYCLSLFGCGDGYANYYHFLCIGEASCIHPNNNKETAENIVVENGRGEILFRGTWDQMEDWLERRGEK